MSPPFLFGLSILNLLAFSRESQAATCGLHPEQCPNCLPTSVPGNVFEFHIVSDPNFPSLDADQLQAIESAAVAWSEIEGSSWSFARGADVLGTDWLVTPDDAALNDINEIILVTNTYWVTHNLLPKRRALVQRHFEFGPPCVAVGGDIVIRDVDFDLDLPTIGDGFSASFPQSMLHEFGHLLGFGHEDSVGTITLMNSSWPHGGDPGEGASFEVWPDEAIIAAQIYPGGSNPIDFSLFKWESVGDGRGREVWTDDAAALPMPIDSPSPAETWEWCPGFNMFDGNPGMIGNPPAPVSFPAPLLLGGQVSADTFVTVEWKLVDENHTCADSTLLISSEQYTVLAGETVEIDAHFLNYLNEPQVGWCIPPQTPMDTEFNICARIVDNDADPRNNTVFSDKIFRTGDMDDCCFSFHFACDGTIMACP